MNVKVTTVKSFLFFVAALANLIDAVVTYESKCPPLRLINGRSRYRWRGRSVQFNCIRGFQLVGAKYATCINGKWDVSAPICVKYGCPAPTHIKGQFLESYRGAVVKIVCNAGYTLVGSPSVYCNGKRWNETFPTCNVTNLNPSTSCDFEDPDLCGWSQDPMHDFDWSRRKVSTSLGNFTPPADHTPGFNGSGSYMYMEIYSFKDRAENYTARLYSPVYPYERSESSCFKFWYFTAGSFAGSFKVYVKPEGVELFDLITSFWINQGETKRWLPGYFPIEPMETPFQIVVEGVSGSKSMNVMAFDDVTLATGDDCVVREETTSTMETTSSVNPEDNSVDFPSCRNQCNLSGGDSAPKSATVSDSMPDWIEVTRCSCQEACVRDGNCCPDYYDYCVFSASSSTTTKREVEASTTSSTPEETTTTTPIVEARTKAKTYQDYNNETNEIDPRNPIPDWRSPPRDNRTDLGRKGEEEGGSGGGGGSGGVVVTTTRKPVQVDKEVAKASERNETVVEAGKGGEVNVTISVRKEVSKTSAEANARFKVSGKKTKLDEIPERKPEMNSTKGVSGGNDVKIIRPVKTDANRTSGNATRKAKGKEEVTVRSSSSTKTTTTTTTTVRSTSTSTSTSTSSSATTPARIYKQLKPNNIKLTFPEKPSRSNMVNDTPYQKGKPKELSGKELPQAIKRKDEGSKEAAFRGILEIAGISLAVLVAVALAVVWYRRSRNRKSERDSMVEDSDSIICHMDSTCSTVERESHSLICIRPGGLTQAT